MEVPLTGTCARPVSRRDAGRQTPRTRNRAASAAPPRTTLTPGAAFAAPPSASHPYLPTRQTPRGPAQSSRDPRNPNILLRPPHAAGRQGLSPGPRRTVAEPAATRGAGAPAERRRTAGYRVIDTESNGQATSKIAHLGDAPVLRGCYLARAGVRGGQGRRRTRAEPDTRDRCGVFFVERCRART